MSQEFADLFRPVPDVRTGMATGQGRNQPVALVFVTEARDGGFGGRQPSIEIAPKTLDGHRIGTIVRADESCLHGFAVPGTRPLVQALFVH